MSTTNPGVPEYEFTAEQNGVFRQLAGAMSGVGVAMMVPGGIAVCAAAYLLLTNGPTLAEGLAVALGAVLLIMAINLVRAAQHFHRISTTRGRDIETLMFAVDELARVYSIERWLWIAFGVALIAGLANGWIVR